MKTVSNLELLSLTDHNNENFFHHLWGNDHEAIRLFQTYHVVHRFAPHDGLFRMEQSEAF